MALNKEQILSADDMIKKTVQVSEWGGEVYVRTMTGAERDKFESMLFDSQGNKSVTENFRAKLLAMCMVDDEGKRLFTDKEVSELGKKSSKAIGRIYEVARKLNGIGIDEEAILEKN
jgi:hypothetical protein